MGNENPLRSARWLDTQDLRGFGRRSRTMQIGYGPADWAGRPVIGILSRPDSHWLAVTPPST
jgi:dihydroxy-acid dehydratase